MSDQASNSTLSPYRWINYFIYLLVCFTAAAGFTAKSTMLSTMAGRWSENLGTVALLLSVFTIWQILLSLPSSIVATKYGFKPVIITGTVFLVAGLLLRSTVDAFIPFLSFTIIAGLGWGLILGPMGKVIANWFPLHERGQANGYFPAGLNGGMAFGSLSSVYFTTSLGWYWGWRIYGLLAVAILILIIFALREKPKSPPTAFVIPENMNVLKELKQVMIRPVIILQLTMIATIGAIVITPGLVFPLLANQGVVSNLAGLISGFSLIGGTLGSLIIPVRAFRQKKIRATMLKCAIMSPLLFLLIFYLPFTTSTVWVVALTALLFGFCTTPLGGMAIGYGMIQKEVNPCNAGLLSGVYLTSVGLGAATIPLIITRVIDAAGGLLTAGAWVQGALLGFSLLVISITVFDQKRI